MKYSSESEYLLPAAFRERAQWHFEVWRKNVKFDEQKKYPNGRLKRDGRRIAEISLTIYKY
jgi:hypothetical protein